MSERATEVDCGRHGISQATFVCRHLAGGGEGLGFCCADDEGNPRPDAWCDECDTVLQQEGEWNDRSEAFAGITVLCAGCYDEARRCNQQGTST
jgi:hypothetical protein